MSDIGTITGTLELKDLLTRVAAKAEGSLGKVEEAGKDLAQTLGSDVGPAVDRAGNKVDGFSSSAKQGGAATQDLDSKVNKLGSDLKGSVSSGITAADSRIKQLTATIAKAGKEAQELGRKVSDVGRDMTAKLTLPIAALGTGSIALATNLNESVANVSALLSGTDAEVARIVTSMKGQIQSLAVAMGKSTGDISSGLYEVISSLGYTRDTFGQLEISAKAANAGLATTQEAFSFLSATTKTYGDTSEAAFKKAADLGFQAVNLGQCLVGSTLVLLADGRVERIEDLEDGGTVVSFDGRNFVPADAHWVDSGIKPTVKLTTKTGREIETTWTHPYLVIPKDQDKRSSKPARWTKVDEISIGDRVAVPASLPFFGTTDPSDAEACLLGLWLAEGSGSSSSPRICSTSYGKEIARWAKRFGCTVKNVEKREGSAPVWELTSGAQGSVQGANRFTTLLRSYGLFPSLSRDKHVPSEVFTWKREKLALFLRWLMNGDGWLAENKSGYQLGFCSASERLVRDVSHLLIRFGVVGKIRKRTGKWCWETQRREEILRYLDFIGIDRESVEAFRSTVTDRQWMSYGVVLYDEVVAIEEGPDQHVYDLCVPGMANFVAGDFVAHNTTFPELSAQIGSVAPIAEMAGVSMEEMFAVIATATGVTGNTAKVTTQMAAAISGLIDPSEEMAKLYKRLGVASGEALIEQKGMVGALQAVAQFAEATGTPLAKLLGRQEAVILAASLAGSQSLKFAENLEAMGRAAVAGGKVVDDAFRRQTEGVNKAGFAWKQFKAEAQVAMERLGDVLIPIAMNVANSLRPMWEGVQSLLEQFAKLPAPLQTAVVAFAGLLAAAGPLLVIAGQITIAWGGIAAALPAVGTAIGGVVGVLSGPVGWVALGAALLAAWKPAKDFIVDLAGVITRIFGGAVRAIVETVKMWWDSMEDVRAPIVKLAGVVTSFSGSGLKSYIQNLHKGIDTLSRWWRETETARRFVFELAKVIRADLFMVLGKVGSAIKFVIDLLVSLGKWVVGVAVKIKDLVVGFLTWTGMIPALQAGIGMVISTLKSLWTWLINTRDKIFEWVETIGGWGRVIAAVNPALGATIALVGRWVERAKEGVSAAQLAAGANRDLAKSQEEVAATAGAAGAGPASPTDAGTGGGFGGGLSDEHAKALKAVQDRIEALGKEKQAVLDRLAALKLSPVAYQAERREQEILATVDAERQRLQEQGLSLSSKLQAGLEREAGALFDANTATERYTEAVNLAVDARQKLSSFTVPSDLNFEVNDDSTKSWAANLASLGFEISNVKLILSTLPKESFEYQKTLDVLTETEGRYQKALAQLPNILQARDTARTRETRSQLSLAAVAERLIDDEIEMLGKGSKAWNDYLKQLDARGRAKQIIGEFTLPRPSSTDVQALEEWKRLFAQYREQLDSLTTKIELSIDADSAAQLRESLKTPRQIFEEFAEEVSRLMGLGLLSEAEAKRLIARADEVASAIRESLTSAADSINASLSDAVVSAAFEGKDAWEALSSSLLSITKNLVGEWLQIWVKALAAWLKRWIATQVAAKAAQAALGTGGGVSGAGIGSNLAGANWTSLGGSGSSASGMSSAAVGIGATAAIFALVYVGVKKWIESHKEYAANVTFQLTKDSQAAVSNISGNTKQIRGLTQAVQDAGRMVNDFLAQLGGELEGMSAKVVLGRTGRGKSTSFFVQLEDGMKVWFGKYEEALEFALLSAIKSSKVSGFSPLMEQGLAGFDVNSGSMEGLGEFLAKLKEVSQLNWSDTARQVSATVGNLLDLWDAVHQLKTLTPEVKEAWSSLGASIVNAFQSWQDRLTGRTRNPQEQLLLLQNDGKLYNAELKLQIARFNMRLNDLAFERKRVENLGNITKVGHEIDKGDLKIKGTLLNIRADQIQTELTLEQQRLEFIDAEMAALAEIIAQLSTMTLDIGSIKLPSTGGVGSTLDSVRDFIANTKWELAVRGMSEYQAAVTEVTRKYDEQIEQAGKDAKLRAELIALKEKELALLAKERVAGVVDSFRSFLGLVDPFQQIRDAAADLIKSIQDSPLGDARKARMIGRVLAEMERQLQELANQSAVSLFGGLAADLEKLGVAEKTQTELRRNSLILEHTIKMANYRAELALLRAQGLIAPEMLAVAEKALGILEGLDPAKLLDDGNPFGPNRTGRTTPQEQAAAAAKALEDQLAKVRDKLKKYQDIGLDPLQAKLIEINNDFAEIRRWLGDTPEVLAAYNLAIADYNSMVRKATNETYSALTEFYKSLTTGDIANSNLTTEQQFNATEARLNELISSVRDGNTEMVDDLAATGQEYSDLLAKMFGTSTLVSANRQAELRERIRQVLAAAGVDIPGEGGVAGGSALLPRTSTEAAIAAVTSAMATVKQADSQNTAQVVAASQGIAEVINFRAVRQESQLSTLATLLQNVYDKLEEIREENGVTPIEYGRMG